MIKSLRFLQRIYHYWHNLEIFLVKGFPKMVLESL